MAKRKRLTVPVSAPDDGPSETVGAPPAEAPETKGFPLGVARTRSRPPIAQVAGATAAEAAVGELTEALSSARAEGRLAQSLALDAIDADHLVRDRISADGPALEELMTSLRTRGQRTAIEVVDRGADSRPRYGLISGWRRLTALRQLAQEDPAFARVAAIIRTPETAADAYLSMVEENEIRLGLSYYERARIVVKALQEGVFDDPRTALQSLFASVSRAKRSKIKSFMVVVEALDGSLRFPEALGERMGLDLARICADPDQAAAVIRALAKVAPDTAEAEAQVLADVLAPPAPPKAARPAKAPANAPPEKARPTPAPEPVYLHVTNVGLTISGPGLDDDLIDEVTALLMRRGNYTP